MIQYFLLSRRTSSTGCFKASSLDFLISLTPLRSYQSLHCLLIPSPVAKVMVSPCLFTALSTLASTQRGRPNLGTVPGHWESGASCLLQLSVWLVAVKQAPSQVAGANTVGTDGKGGSRFPRKPDHVRLGANAIFCVSRSTSKHAIGSHPAIRPTTGQGRTVCSGSVVSGKCPRNLLASDAGKNGLSKG